MIKYVRQSSFFFFWKNFISLSKGFTICMAMTHAYCLYSILTIGEIAAAWRWRIGKIYIFETNANYSWHQIRTGIDA